jgi:hypothetical protein
MEGFHRWVLAGALVTFGTLGILSIGLPFLLAGVVLAIHLAVTAPRHAYGLAFGVGGVLVALGLPWTPAVAEAGAVFLAAGVAACFSSHARERQL